MRDNNLIPSSSPTGQLTAVILGVAAQVAVKAAPALIAQVLRSEAMQEMKSGVAQVLGHLWSRIPPFTLSGAAGEGVPESLLSDNNFNFWDNFRESALKKYREGNTLEALNDINIFINNVPNIDIGYRIRALCYTQLKDYKLALMDYKQYMRDKSEDNINSEDAYNIAALYRMSGNLDTANYYAKIYQEKVEHNQDVISQLHGEREVFQEFILSRRENGGGAKRVIDFLKENPDQVRTKAPNAGGKTIFTFAVLHNDLELTGSLVADYYQDVLYQKDEGGNTALMFAAASNEVETIRTIVDNIPLASDDVRPVIFELFSEVNHEGMNTVLMAANRDSVDVIRYLDELDEGILRSNLNDGKLLKRVGGGQSLKVLKYLSQHYPEYVNSLDSDGNTAMTNLAFEGSLEGVKYLDKMFPELYKVISISSSSVLKMAVLKNDLEMVDYLFGKHPDLFFDDREHLLDVAKKSVAHSKRTGKDFSALLKKLEGFDKQKPSITDDHVFADYGITDGNAMAGAVGLGGLGGLGWLIRDRIRDQRIIAEEKEQEREKIRQRKEILGKFKTLIEEAGEGYFADGKFIIEISDDGDELVIKGDRKAKISEVLRRLLPKGLFTQTENKVNRDSLKENGSVFEDEYGHLLTVRKLHSGLIEGYADSVRDGEQDVIAALEYDDIWKRFFFYGEEEKTQSGLADIMRKDFARWIVEAEASVNQTITQIDDRKEAAAQEREARQKVEEGHAIKARIEVLKGIISKKEADLKQDEEDVKEDRVKLRKVKSTQNRIDRNKDDIKKYKAELKSLTTTEEKDASSALEKAIAEQNLLASKERQQRREEKKRKREDLAEPESGAAAGAPGSAGAGAGSDVSYSQEESAEVKSAVGERKYGRRIIDVQNRMSKTQKDTFLDSLEFGKFKLSNPGKTAQNVSRRKLQKEGHFSFVELADKTLAQAFDLLEDDKKTYYENSRSVAYMAVNFLLGYEGEDLSEGPAHIAVSKKNRKTLEKIRGIFELFDEYEINAEDLAGFLLLQKEGVSAGYKKALQERQSVLFEVGHKLREVDEKNQTADYIIQLSSLLVKDRKSLERCFVDYLTQHAEDFGATDLLGEVLDKFTKKEAFLRDFIAKEHFLVQPFYESEEFKNFKGKLEQQPSTKPRPTSHKAKYDKPQESQALK